MKTKFCQQRHDVEKLTAQFPQYLAKTGQMLTGGLMAEATYFSMQFRQSCRRHDVGKQAVKCSQFLAYQVKCLLLLLLIFILDKVIVDNR